MKKPVKADAETSVKTVLVIAVGFVIVHLATDLKAFLVASVAVGVLGLLHSKIAMTIHFLWMKLAFVLGLIIPNILLSLIFYLFLTPIAWLSRLTGKRDIMKKSDKYDSLWVDREHAVQRDSFEKPW